MQASSSENCDNGLYIYWSIYNVFPKSQPFTESVNISVAVYPVITVYSTALGELSLEGAGNVRPDRLQDN